MSRVSRFRSLLIALLGLPIAVAAQPGTDGVVVIDDFEAASGWEAHPADGVRLQLVSGPGVHGKSMGLEFAFTGGGYAIARKEVAIDLPADWAFSFQVRGESGVNHLEFKLVDSTNENVWWNVRRDFAFPKDWRKLVTKKRQVSFAWGPAGGGEIRHVAAIEIVVTAATGGSGTVWIDDLELRALPPADSTPAAPAASASSSRQENAAELAIDGDPATAWRALRKDRHAWFGLDFGAAREFGGLSILWSPERHAIDYDVEASDDGTSWNTLRRVRDGNGGTDDLYLPESEARWVRMSVLRAASSDGAAIGEVTVQPLAWSATRNAFFEAIARARPRGLYPRSMGGEQSYWTVVGADADTREALLDEDGRLETGAGQFALEPVLQVGKRLWTWADAEIEHTLEQGCLPIPTVRWCCGDLTLAVTAFATGAAESSGVVARYRVTNHGTKRQRGSLVLAARPFQVNPPPQFLNGTGGYAPIRYIETSGQTMRVGGAPAVVSLVRPSKFGASTFDSGDIVADWLHAGRFPSGARIEDEFEAASAAWVYEFNLRPGREGVVDVFVPLHGDASLGQVPQRETAAWVDARLVAARTDWDEKTSRVTLQLPESARHVVETLRAQIGDILVNRAGPAIQPGTRAYARSWIRDGALTCTALLRCGHAEAVRAFIEWFAPHQYTSGKIPCVVDRRGADPVPEHDSHGEFIYLVAEYYRFTGDRGLLERQFPRMRAAAVYLDSLRQTRRTPEFATGDARVFFGLLPPSISHEGYSAKPMHSYWDDFWARRGFRDVAFAAGVLGHDAERKRWEATAAEFEHDLATSVRAAGKKHRIDFVPGCADLGDFDATSTTIGLSPTGAADVLPAAVVKRTFETYMEHFTARKAGGPWDAFTPYEIRNIGAAVRLGWRERANEQLDWFLTQQRPREWRQWPEVVWPESRTPRFLGDLPHTWVGSDYIRSVLDMLAYERDSDDALVLAAGAPPAWLEGDGIELRGLRTRFGELAYTMYREGDAVVLYIEPGIQIPPGGIQVRALVESAKPWGTVNGVQKTLSKAYEIEVRSLPARVEIRQSADKAISR